ncbi:ubiquinol-cytochrome c reductase iron-sulfur subunit [Saccharopolyspora cebuensis]|uniref:Cytochrome bc1 complex Rieske iron-sulfur subunit n=1 Tax=Saccharopolyspora cebuensis TaxID=418759 RepID=A0ABV4CP91_9PSEU
MRRLFRRGRRRREAERADLLRRGSAADGVSVVVKERTGGPRAERIVALWFALAAVFAVLFVAAYVLWPHEYRRPAEHGHLLYLLYTPVIGTAFGCAFLCLAVGVGLHSKRVMPQELAVQRRQDGPSEDFARRSAAARLTEIAEDAGAGRPLLRRALLGAGAFVAAATAVLGVGGFVRDPWTGRRNAALWITGWHPVSDEKVYLRVHTGVLGRIVLVRPEDLEPGTLLTVVPFRESERGHEELLLAAERASDGPVMLIRLRPGTAVRKRPGQEEFNHGDFYAFSKICTHLGCPASQYDAQNNVALCPCHQSQFLITESAKPVFGPATRSLPQLPITVDEDGYFIARGDFREPVGPGFWEVRLDR